MNASTTSQIPEAGPLDLTTTIDEGTVRSFRDKGHAVVRGLATARELEPYRSTIEMSVARLASRVPPVNQRGTYGKAFLQATNLWRTDERIRSFVFAARFARAAASLLETSSVRLYHDQAVFKEPGGGHTPWHQDQTYWPLDTDKTITMWMPLVDVPAEVGTMTFANGAFRHGNLGPWVIGDESDRGFSDVVDRLGLATETHGPLQAGDATFHRGWTLHRAPANPTRYMRPVMTVIYFADGARVSHDLSGARAFDHRFWLDSIPAGELANGRLNPVLWPR